LAARLVNAPSRIAAAAETGLRDARPGSLAERSALRLYACAALWAIQMSRPLRRANLLTARTGVADRRLTWTAGGTRAELRIDAREVKNRSDLIVPISGDDAAILRRWMTDLRPRYAALNGASTSPYILPGDARPPRLRDGITLPHGCLSGTTIHDLWSDGAALIGIVLPIHGARHAVATLMLAMRPGAYALAATVLGDTEATVRRHYAHEDARRAAAAAREALLAAHPDLENKMRWRAA
jgi:integrase